MDEETEVAEETRNEVKLGPRVLSPFNSDVPSIVVSGPYWRHVVLQRLNAWS